MKMDFGVLLVLTLLWKMSSSLRCYKCDAKFETYTEQLCQHFDYSDKYIVDCEHSTMCYKKETSSTLGNGLKIYERGCAKQIFEGDQEHTSSGWRHVNRIYEAYNEGCEGSPANPDRVTSTLLCYCRGDYCNGATNIGSVTGLLLTLGLFLFLR